MISKTVPAGTRVSYGGYFKAQRPTRVATLPVGYADGFRRTKPNVGHVLLKGRFCPVLGRVTMDQIMVDATPAPNANVGDEVVLIGKQGHRQITAWDMARWSGTIPYEILTGIAQRVPRLTQ